MTSRITFPLTLSGMIETLKTINLRYDDRILFSGFDGNPKIETSNDSNREINTRPSLLQWRL